ncbi:phosphohistidine phosphatase SixA [bacterium]|nr:phosphohistidine phosphatase SixA [candidate division CSSED10-310 bacterium]
MKIYLVQHAHTRPETEGSDRPLSQQGWRDIRKIAAFVSEQTGCNVSGICHSGKLRALQTAQVLDERLKTPEGSRAEDGLDPGDPPGIWAERLNARATDLMLVGHLPHLARLTGLLVCGDETRLPIRFTRAGIVCLDQNEDGIWSVTWMITPQIVRSSRWGSLGVEH